MEKTRHTEPTHLESPLEQLKASCLYQAEELRRMAETLNFEEEGRALTFQEFTILRMAFASFLAVRIDDVQGAVMQNDLEGGIRELRGLTETLRVMQTIARNRLPL